MMKRNFLYSLGASVLLAGAVSAWKTTPAAQPETAKSEAAKSGVSKITEVNSKISPSGPAVPAGASGKPNIPAVGEALETALPATALSYEAAYTDYVGDLYNELDLAGKGLQPEIFKKALTGFYNLKAAGKLAPGKEVLSIVDFTKSSREKRLWIIDLDNKELLFRSLVAHGKKSGGNMASSFSNTESSHQSSLGFYLTGEVYYGKHGRSLRLDGMDPGFNSNARKRAIVLHGADYVSQAFINRVGRLGRSFGCPAVPEPLCDEIIDHIKEKTVLFINGPGEKYKSDYLNVKAAARYLLPANG
ncbi:L,D-transpeptidase-like protein [Anseongella ginsenosidimutans]|uniref:L,D-transpeptidase-like protein n=1 Tax=Anseongella ginsenosidimutans TaxID=496056 RepID=A0A4R3KWH4_9SPHI|nr:murein L,D-transpeptidase catalytic domain family protein [Anseongella ginsenosidimutans]TCS88281.1 L,D-transpeptidase-like protein [Anseongella ginsenosidimutans]